ncbi:DNA cytosine methyltransferase [Brevibacterium picturae]|uniref:DNA cytosine methyltransferase n=1 Tax=Brevibacterium picturae TaxID=260553 RepID=UPI0031F810A6
MFSRYGGLDLAVEEVFNAETAWFSEINEPVVRVFARHGPDASNPGDITTIDRSTTGGHALRGPSIPGRVDRGQAGRPCPRHSIRLWAYAAAAIDALQPAWVVIENVRGLFSAPGRRCP